MRPINLIIIHCSAIRPTQTSSAKQIDAWHKAQGWKCIGYHYVVRRDGTIEVGRPESQVGAHTSGYGQPTGWLPLSVVFSPLSTIASMLQCFMSFITVVRVLSKVKS